MSDKPEADSATQGIWGTLVQSSPPPDYPAHGYISTRRLGDVLFFQVESPAVDILPQAVTLFPLHAVDHIEVLSEAEVRLWLSIQAANLTVRENHEVMQEIRALRSPKA